MREDLRRLVRLQDVMLQVEGLNEKIAAVPEDVARLEKALLAAGDETEKGKTALKDLQKERRRLEMELMGVESKIQKYQSQLSEVKTNKEYQAILHEIEACRQERSRLDEKILLDMEESEKGDAACRRLEDGLKEARRRTEEGKKDLQRRLETLQADKAILEKERQELQQSIQGLWLDPFLKIARQRKGLALVPVRDELCGGCHVRVMPKLIQEVRRSVGLIACDSCKRYLYVPDDAPPPVAAGAKPSSEPVAAPAETPDTSVS
jgi:predicted  nucleic acid-binding Zn-ribbon protein